MLPMSHIAKHSVMVAICDLRLGLKDWFSGPLLSS